MAARSSEETALLEKAARLFPGGVLGGYHAPPELNFVVREARGPRLCDVSGREYIDYILGSGPLVLGHAHPAVLEAVSAQLGKGTTYFQVSEPALALAEEIYFTEHPIADYRATLTADRALHAAFTAELIRRGVVKAAQKFYVSLAHGEEEVSRTIEIFREALEVVAGATRS
jgi:glutamate-1-semialdehyde aminotransferase